MEKVRDRVPRLAAIADVVGDFRQFTDEVDRSISSRGEVADAASEQLAATRRELRIAESRLEQRAQAALADAIRRGVAQEGLLTERNGRKVIPVKADYRGQVSGIVHDVSSSGATLFIEPMASSMRATGAGAPAGGRSGSSAGPPTSHAAAGRLGRAGHRLAGGAGPPGPAQREGATDPEDGGRAPLPARSHLWFSHPGRPSWCEGGTLS